MKMWEIRVYDPTGRRMCFTEMADTAQAALEKFRKGGKGCQKAVSRSGGILCVFPA